MSLSTEGRKKVKPSHLRHKAGFRTRSTRKLAGTKATKSIFLPARGREHDDCLQACGHANSGSWKIRPNHHLRFINIIGGSHPDFGQARPQKRW